MAFGVQLHQIKRNFANRLGGPLLRLHPSGAAHFAELRRSIAIGAKPTEASQLIGGHPQDAIGILNNEVIANLTADRQFFELFEATNSMVAMHHKIPLLHLVGINGAAGRFAPPTHVTAAGERLLSKKFAIRKKNHPPRRKLQSFELSCSSGF